MMGDERLPDDLVEIERRLRSDASGPNPALRTKVMGSVDGELRRSQRTGFWQFAAAVAATVLVLINVGVSAAFIPPRAPRVEPGRAAALYEQLARLELDLPPAELRRQCALMAAGERLLPSGRPRGSAAEVSAALEER